MRLRHRGLVVATMSALSVVLAWQLVTDGLHLMNPILLPSPLSVLRTFTDLLDTPYVGATLPQHLLASAAAVILGWLLALVIGVPVGVALAWKATFQDYVGIVVNLLRPVPPPAWVPFALLWFGVSRSGAVFVVLMSAVMPVLLNTQDAVRNVDPLLVSAGRTLGSRGITTLRTIVLPVALPGILTGARIALGNAWMTVVAAELVASSVGLGYAMRTAQGALLSPIVIAVMLTIGLAGALMSGLLTLAVRRAMPWAQAKDERS